MAHICIGGSRNELTYSLYANCLYIRNMFICAYKDLHSIACGNSSIDLHTRTLNIDRIPDMPVLRKGGAVCSRQ